MSKDWCDQSLAGSARVLHGFWTCWPSQDLVILHHIRRNPRIGSATEINRTRKLCCQTQKSNCFGTDGATCTNGTNGIRFQAAIVAHFKVPVGFLSASFCSEPRQSLRFDRWKSSNWNRYHPPPSSGDADRRRSTRDHNSDAGVPIRCKISSMPTWQDQYTLGNF